MDILLTVAIPTYNRPKTLKRALDAISAQYDERVEVLVCDDSTNNDVQTVVEEMSSNIPIRYIKNPENLGFNKNFLQCFREAKGEYVLLMGDDDLIINLPHIMEYLTENKAADWIFVNHCSFKKEWVDFGSSAILARKTIEDKIGVSKKEFMDYAGFGITCDTTILRKDKVEDFNFFENLETFFMQTCIPIVATQSSENVLGIIGEPCLAFEAAAEEANLYKNTKAYFQAYGMGLRKVFCDIAPKCGYDKRQMRKIFRNSIMVLAHPVAYMNSENISEWKTNFWEYCYPEIKDFATAWIFVIPIALAPRWLAKFLFKKVYPFCHNLVAKLR